MYVQIIITRSLGLDYIRSWGKKYKWLFAHIGPVGIVFGNNAVAVRYSKIFKMKRLDLDRLENTISALEADRAAAVARGYEEGFASGSSDYQWALNMCRDNELLLSTANTRVHRLETTIKELCRLQLFPEDQQEGTDI